MSFWRRPFGQRQAEPQVAEETEVVDGSLHYVAEKAGNDSTWTYQEASGAPVETKSPLGYNVGPITIIFLNVSMMIGTGVYSTRELVDNPSTSDHPRLLT